MTDHLTIEETDEHQASRDLGAAIADFMAEAPLGARGEFDAEVIDLIALARLIKTAATTYGRLSAALRYAGTEGTPLNWIAEPIADELTEEAARVFLAALRAPQ